MFRLHPLLIGSLIIACVLQLAASHDEQIIDLTYSFDENSLFFPGHVPFVHEILHRGPYGPFWYETNKFATGEHTGTHMDAPVHGYKGHLRMDEIPVDHLVGPGIKVDMSAKASINPDALLEVEDLIAWEKENGAIPDGAILMVFTDWGKYYPNRILYFGSDRNDTIQDADGNSILHFPGVGENATDWLLENRNIVGLGIDTASFDYGQSTTYPTHIKLFEQNIFGLENVANLDKMPTRGTTIYALPMKIKDGSGAPVRILAIPGDAMTCGACTTHQYEAFISIFVVLMVYIINC